LFLRRSECAVEPVLPDAFGILDQVVGGGCADFMGEAGGAFAHQKFVRQTAHDLARHADRVEASRYDRVVLWFEHDTYDQFKLARCLAKFAETPPAYLEMVTLEHYPGAMRFIGLGQLPPEALRLLWNERKPVTKNQVDAGQTAWNLLRLPDPTPLAKAAAAGFTDLPYLARALRRHCQELPLSRNGLSLTERLILQLLAERPRTIGEVFRDLMLEREPLPWLGDLMLSTLIENMKRASRPVFDAVFETGDTTWPREHLTITSLGRSVLAGDVDWLSLSPPERWLGGVCIRADRPCWRWDDRQGTTECSQ
jgi:hypothetical protein